MRINHTHLMNVTFKWLLLLVIIVISRGSIGCGGGLLAEVGVEDEGDASDTGETSGVGDASDAGETSGVGETSDAGDTSGVGVTPDAPVSVADETAPTMTSSNPADGDMFVAINKTITATFDEPMNALMITTDNYTLTGPGSISVSGVVDYDSSTHVASFNPDDNLVSNTTFTVTVTTGVQDSAGNALASDSIWTFTTSADEAQTNAQSTVPLGSASSFAILASAAITNIATSNITGDIGLTPDAGSNISGFSDPLTCPEITGDMYVVDATGPACAVIDPSFLSDAKADAETAFTDARAAVRGTPAAISGNLNGLTLYPGLYESGSSLEISPGGFLYLDAQGDSSAIFIIRSATSITTEATSEVVLTKGALAANVYWIAGSAVTLGVNSIMKGTFVAGTALSLLTGANLEGRALNQGAAAAAITLDEATITVPSP